MIGAALALLLQAAHAEAPVSRWVITVAAHDGGPSRERLRHVEADATAVADALSRFAPTARTHVLSLIDPDPAAILATLDDVRRAIDDEPGVRHEVVFYYSGHADGRGLLPGSTPLPWDTLRRVVGELPADIRVGIVDACASGALARTKGGVHDAPFLVDRRDLVRGEVWLASAAEDEAAQESDRLGGSYFTHHLVHGLLGAADRDDDARVTLSEAYTWAYEQTVRGTETTWTGPQHPTYAFRLVGQGDVVLTDLRDRDGALRLDRRLDGELSVRDADGRLVAELVKENGVPLAWALASGPYTLRLRARDRVYTARINVPEGGEVSLAAADFRQDTALERTRTRGDPTVRGTDPAAFSFAPFLGTTGLRADRAIRGVEVNLFGGASAGLTGLSIGLGHVSRGDVVGAQLAPVFAWAGGDLVGAQLALINRSGREMRGFQGGLLTWSGASARGMQIAGLNWAQGSHTGVQWGVANVVRGRSAQGHVGWQLGAVNVAATGQVGSQWGIANLSERMRGLQLGVFNVAREMNGVQVGLVNVARGGRPVTFGLLNLVDGGYRAIGVTTSDTQLLQVDLKTGGRVVYGVLALGLDPTTRPAAMAWGGGLGVHVERGLFTFDVDFLTMVRERDPADAFGRVPDGVDIQLRPQLGVRAGAVVDLFLGPTLAFGVPVRAAGTGQPPSTFLPVLVEGAGPFGRDAIWVGYTAGARFRF